MPISFSFFLHCIKHKEIYKLLCFCCVDKAIQGLFSNMKSSNAQKQEFIGVKEMYRRSKGKGGHWCKINSWCSWGHFDFFLLYKIFDSYKRDNKYTFPPPPKRRQTSMWVYALVWCSKLYLPSWWELRLLLFLGWFRHWSLGAQKELIL